ncbi:hypothetical protein [Maricaulis salignorans]|uniref:Uncharacterized protein n=1 Tax=Maricaulis salignorans TaxID=144026 RepID=A0A1G9WJS5_9PROT|nr:hypothetical protein [Maricaulis salignorans]SDM84431.1 hypothetical protein SAMN04488568_12527 [Maricaulis salignorans]
MARVHALQIADDNRARARRLTFAGLGLAALISIIIGQSLTGAPLAPA